MSIIFKDVSNGKETLIDEVSYKYLYPVFYVLNYQFNLEIENNKPIFLSDNMLLILYERISDQLSFLLETCYQDPIQSEIKKRPSWYEKFVYMEKTYEVNYTTSGIGRLLFTINSRLIFIKRIIDSKSTLSLTIVDL
jgi:hypothetical protein